MQGEYRCKLKMVFSKGLNKRWIAVYVVACFFSYFRILVHTVRINEETKERGGDRKGQANYKAGNQQHPS